MREKILAELMKKYTGLSKKILGLVADKLAKTVTEESAIEGAVAALDNLPITLKEFADFNQKDGDARVTEALKRAKPSAESGDNDDPEKKETSTGTDANNPMMKLLTELTNEVKSLKQEKRQQTMTEKLHAKLKEKKIPLHLSKGRSVEKEEDLDNLVAEIETDYTDLKQELANQGFSQTSEPVGGGSSAASGKADNKSAIADIEAWAKSTAPQVQGASSKS